MIDPKQPVPFTDVFDDDTRDTAGYTIVCQSILHVAPDITLGELDRSAELSLDLGLDSIDLVNLASEILARGKVEIPEADYARLHQVGDLADYVDSYRGAATPA